MIEPYVISIWEHHTLYITIALVTIFSIIMKFNFYILCLIAVLLDPLSLFFMYFYGRLNGINF